VSADGQDFVHLRVRSAYSLLEGAIKADAIAELAAAEAMPAVALTDRANLFGALEFSVVTKDHGVQPIVGCSLPVSGIGEGPSERWALTPTIVLLAQNETGTAICANSRRPRSSISTGSRRRTCPGQRSWHTAMASSCSQGDLTALLIHCSPPDGARRER